MIRTLNFRRAKQHELSTVLPLMEINANEKSSNISIKTKCEFEDVSQLDGVHPRSLPVITHIPTSLSLPSSQPLTVATSTQITVSEDYCSEQQPV